jgi:hypothetical protein
MVHVMANCSVCLIRQVPRHVGVWRSTGLDPPFLNLALDGSGELHSTAALTQDKEHPVPIRQETGQAPDSVWTL